MWNTNICYRTPFRYSNELYELQASRWEWRKLRPRPPRSGQAGPCPRLGHSFTLGSDGMSYVFGGLTHESTPEGAVTRYLNDLYVVDLKNAPNGLQWVCPQVIRVVADRNAVYALDSRAITNPARVSQRSHRRKRYDDSAGHLRRHVRTSPWRRMDPRSSLAYLDQSHHARRASGASLSAHGESRR